MRKLLGKIRGSELEIVYHDRDAIANIYEKINRKNSISVSLKYKQMQPAYNVQTRKIDSFVGCKWKEACPRDFK